MNEKEFGRMILERFKKDGDLKHWYEKNLEGQDFAGTIPTICLALCKKGGLSVEEAVLLSLFIGLSTEPKPMIIGEESK